MTIEEKANEIVKRVEAVAKKTGQDFNREKVKEYAMKIIAIDELTEASKKSK